MDLFMTGVVVLMGISAATFLALGILDGRRETLPLEDAQPTPRRTSPTGPRYPITPGTIRHGAAD
jgi:hypothetical protein